MNAAEAKRPGRRGHATEAERRAAKLAARRRWQERTKHEYRGLSLLISPEEKAQLRELASDAGVSVNKWVRGAIKVLHAELKSQGQP